MSKKLSEMSLEELWQLFPVFLTEHKVCWVEWYAEEKAVLEEIIPQAERIFHLHLRYAGDNDELYFRDYLIEHPDIAIEYEKMKLKLWKEYEHNRDEYTNAKTEFIQRYTEKAKSLYRNR